VRNFSKLAGALAGYALFGVTEDVKSGGPQSRTVDRLSVRRRLGASVSSVRLNALLREHWVLILIFCIGIAVRLLDFGSVPPGLNQDEASTGYDAYALLHYGIDRNGFHNPVMLVSWGSGMNALPSYLAMPFLLLFGLSVAAVRAVNLTGGILTLLAFYLLVRRTGDKTLALLATFLLAVSPWHIMISRWALESNLLPALFLLGVLFLSRAREYPRSTLWAAVFFALTLYSYGTAYLATPLFLVLASLSYLWYRPRSWKPVAQGGVIFCVLALPIALDLVVNQFKLSSIKTPVLSMPRLPSQPRYQTISTLFGGGGPNALWHNVRDFWHVLRSGNDGLIWNAVPGFGYVFAVSLGLAALGLVVLLSRRRFWLLHTQFLLLAWLAAAVVLGASEEVNVNRINLVFLPLIFFTAVGIRALAASRVLLAAIIAFYCFAFVSFTHKYFGSYRAQASAAFYPSFGKAIDTASSATSGPLCITGRVNQPYIFVLFYRRIDPHVFEHTVTYENPGAEFQNVSSFDRYTFGLDRCDPATTQGYVADQEEAGQINRAHFSTEQIGRYVVGLRR
jgi:4-amino-4-deoxy-L-arabinose transferase-like glycosyltransferase